MDLKLHLNLETKYADYIVPTGRVPMVFKSERFTAPISSTEPREDYVRVEVVIPPRMASKILLQKEFSVRLTQEGVVIE